MNDGLPGDEERDAQNSEFFDFPTFAPTLNETQDWKCLEKVTIEAFEINHDGTILRFALDDGYKIVAFARGDARVSPISVARMKRTLRRPGFFVREVYYGTNGRDIVTFYGHRSRENPRTGRLVRAALKLEFVVLGLEEGDEKAFDWICIDTMFADPK